jgi:hypothetical protein
MALKYVMMVLVQDAKMTVLDPMTILHVQQEPHRQRACVTVCLVTFHHLHSVFLNVTMVWFMEMKYVMMELFKDARMTVQDQTQDLLVLEEMIQPQAIVLATWSMLSLQGRLVLVALAGLRLGQCANQAVEMERRWALRLATMAIWEDASQTAWE